jgi:hypothetical protein
MTTVAVPGGGNLAAAFTDPAFGPYAPAHRERRRPGLGDGWCGPVTVCHALGRTKPDGRGQPAAVTTDECRRRRLR